MVVKVVKFIKIFTFIEHFCAKLTAKLVLVMYMGRDDIVYWAVLHKTKLYFSILMTNWDCLDWQNDLL